MTPKPKFKKRFGSFAFFIAIPLTVIGAIICLRSAADLIQRAEYDPIRLRAYLIGLIPAAIFFSVVGMHRIRTFIHETKHAVLVLFTGNNVKRFRSGKYEGQVDYEMYLDTLHMEPFVLLAPYCWPLFSLPVLVAAMIFEGSSTVEFLIAVGATLACDTIFGYREIHPAQTDLKRLWGGWFVTRPFIYGLHIFWFSLCTVWALGGRAALQHTGLRAIELIDSVLRGG